MDEPVRKAYSVAEEIAGALDIIEFKKNYFPIK